MITYGYIRTSRTLEPGSAGSDPESQRLQLRATGVEPRRIYVDAGISGIVGVNTRRGWEALDARLQAGDVLVVAAIDRIGRRYQDVMNTIHELHHRGVRLRSLAEAEATWCRYLDTETNPDSPEWFMGTMLAAFAAYAAGLERQAISRRTISGLERARSQGKSLGRPAKLSPDRAVAYRQRRENGESLRSLAREVGIGRSAMRRAIGTIAATRVKEAEI